MWACWCDLWYFGSKKWRLREEARGLAKVGWIENYCILTWILHEVSWSFIGNDCQDLWWLNDPKLQPPNPPYSFGSFQVPQWTPCVCCFGRVASRADRSIVPVPAPHAVKKAEWVPGLSVMPGVKAALYKTFGSFEQKLGISSFARFCIL